MHNITIALDRIVREARERRLSDDYIRILIKEYLQDVILYAIYNNSSLKSLIFYGGTCLRKVFGLNRLSEDLDFENPKKVSLELVESEILEYFKKISFENVETKIQKGNLVNRITFKFEILYDLGLSVAKNEKLYVKVEVNENLSGNYTPMKTPYIKGAYSMVINHYDLQTLFSSKIVACLERNFKKGNSSTKIKGRDFYDLIWYMSKKVAPNIQKLLDVNKKYTDKEVWSFLDDKVIAIKTNDLSTDLLPLFEDSDYINSWCESFKEMYKNLKSLYIK